MKQNSIVFLMLLLPLCLALSCEPKEEPDPKPDPDKDSQETTIGGRIGPGDSGQFDATLSIETDLSEYFRLDYTIVGSNRLRQWGSLGRLVSNGFAWDKYSAIMSWEPQEGSVKLAVCAEQLKNFSSELFAPGSKHDFVMTFTLTTPDDGYKITWCNIRDKHFDDEDGLYDGIVKAINRGVDEGTPGTGRTNYVQLDITVGEDGGYVISNPVWNEGNIIDRE